MTGKPMQIKFRGICVLQGEFFGKWVYGDLLQKKGKTYIRPHANSVRVDGHIGNLLIMHEVDPQTVGQYTGLKDRNDKEIYEGDIVSLPVGEINNNLMSAVIEWEFNGWKFRWLKSRVSYIRGKEIEPVFHNIKLFEVIDNTNDMVVNPIEQST